MPTKTTACLPHIVWVRSTHKTHNYGCLSPCAEGNVSRHLVEISTPLDKLIFWMLSAKQFFRTDFGMVKCIRANAHDTNTNTHTRYSHPFSWRSNALEETRQHNRHHNLDSFLMPNIAHYHPRNELPKLEQQLSEEVFVIHAQLARRGTCCPREPTVQHFGGSVHLHCSGIAVCPMPLTAERRDWHVVCRGFLDEKTVQNFYCRQTDHKPQCASMKSRNSTGRNVHQKRFRNRHASLANFQFKAPTAAACLVFTGEQNKNTGRTVTQKKTTQSVFQQH